MKLVLHRSSMDIIPETDQDYAYLEDTLGFKKDEAVLQIIRADHEFSSKNLSLIKIIKKDF